jgi:hypothetical protein
MMCRVCLLLNFTTCTAIVASATPLRQLMRRGRTSRIVTPLIDNAESDRNSSQALPFTCWNGMWRNGFFLVQVFSGAKKASRLLCRKNADVRLAKPCNQKFLTF